MYVCMYVSTHNYTKKTDYIIIDILTVPMCLISLLSGEFLYKMFLYKIFTVCDVLPLTTFKLSLTVKREFDLDSFTNTTRRDSELYYINNV